MHTDTKKNVALALAIGLIAVSGVSAQRTGSGTSMRLARTADAGTARDAGTRDGGVRDAAPATPAMDMTGWTRLGERWADGTMERDQIVASPVEGTFRRAMIKVDESRIDLLDVMLVFGDGRFFSPGTRLSFAPGTSSHVIDLPGVPRVIRRLEFRYANLPTGARAKIELWAR